jgi:predicted nucleic acid-binding protein
VIILDTNVLSELMRPAPAQAVVRWFATRPAATVYTTSVTQGEILYGVLLLPASRRRRGIEAAARAMFEEDLAGRVLPFDAGAAAHYADIAAARRRAGRPISQSDAQIAAIARAAGAAIATRNVGDFGGCGVDVIDPWTA